MAPCFFMEVACTVHQDNQGRGLGTLLQQHLENYVKLKGLAGAAGDLFQDNMRMLKTFARKGSYSGEILENGILRVVRCFDLSSG